MYRGTACRMQFFEDQGSKIYPIEWNKIADALCSVDKGLQSNLPVT